MEDDQTKISINQSTPASVRREQWREAQQLSIGSIDDSAFEPESKVEEREQGLKPPDPLFKFDSLEHEQESTVLGRQAPPGPHAEDADVVHYPSRSPQSSFSSPQVSLESPHFCLSPQISVDSPRISFSPLQIRDSIEEEEHFGPHRSQSLTVPDHLIYQQPPSPRSSRGRPGPGHRSPSLLRWPGPPSTAHSQHSSGSNSLYPASPYTCHSPRARSVSPISPAARSAPRSPTPGYSFGHYEQYFRSRFVQDETYRRCMSDTDLSTAWQAARSSSYQSQELPEEAKYDCVFYSGIRYPPKTSSIESDQSSLQEFPLDLSMRSSLSSTSTSESLTTRFLFPSRKPPRLSSSSLHSLSSEKEPQIKKYNLEVGPVAETREPDSSYDCPLCSQTFPTHDHVAQHIASRHKSRSTDSGGPASNVIPTCVSSNNASNVGNPSLPTSAPPSGQTNKAYPCDVCKRSFARSDMLTRHMRLHTGVKPYTCRMCGQVFSRSDHLATHQRTHTGEKPYRCPSCPYSACRRDMITRHLRTHARYEHQDSSSMEEAKPPPTAYRSVSSESDTHPEAFAGSFPSRKPPPPPTAIDHRHDVSHVDPSTASSNVRDMDVTYSTTTVPLNAATSSDFHFRHHQDSSDSFNQPGSGFVDASAAHLYPRVDQSASMDAISRGISKDS